MKVVVAHNRYVSAQPSGENSVVDTEISLLGQAGVEVLPFMRSSDEIQYYSPARRLTLPMSPVYNRQAQRDLAVLLKAHRPDVLHLHNPYPLLSPWVISTAGRFGVPVVQTVHNYRHVCVSGIFFRDGLPCHDCAGKRFGLPAVVHGCYRGSRRQSAVMASTLALHRGTWRKVSAFLAPTPNIAEFVAGLGIQRDRIIVKPTAVIDPGPSPDQGSGFLFAGRLSAEKGVGLLLEAWAASEPGSLGQLVIAGDGPLRQDVESLASIRYDVTYRGLLDREQMMAAIGDAAVIVVPSTCDDVLPTVAVEALACARPVLGTRMGGLPWLISQDAGWVVEPTVDGLIHGLTQAKSEAASLTGNARKRYESTFSPAAVLAQLTTTYESLAAAGQSST